MVVMGFFGGRYYGVVSVTAIAGIAIHIISRVSFDHKLPPKGFSTGKQWYVMNPIRSYDGLRGEGGKGKEGFNPRP